MIEKFLKADDVHYVLYRFDVDGSIIFVGTALVDGTAIWTANAEFAEKYDNYYEALKEADEYQCRVGYLVKD